MNKKIILLLLTLFASKTYGMEPAPLSPAKEYQQIEEKYQQRFPEEYELIRQPKGTFFEKLPVDLQQELIRYHVAYEKMLDDEYNKLIFQGDVPEKDLYLPSYDIFKDLIEFKGLTLDDFIKSYISPLYSNLMQHKKFKILKLFIEKHAGKSWNRIADRFYRELENSALGRYARYTLQHEDYFLSESDIQAYIDLFQTLIRENLGKKNYIKELYNDLLKKYPKYQPIAEKLIEDKMEANWEEMPTETEEEAIEREMEEFHRF